MVLGLQQVTAKALEEFEVCRGHLNYWAGHADQLMMFRERELIDLADPVVEGARQVIVYFFQV